MIEIDIKEKKFPNKTIYKDLKLQLRNDIYLIKGENGIGKSTLFKILTKLDEDYQGTLKINGIDIKEIGYDDLRTNYISYVEQSSDIFNYLTIKENLELIVSDYDEKEYQKIIEGLRLTELISSSKKLKNFSGGEQQKVQILIGLLSKAPIVLLDEPDNNLDIESIKFLKNYLLEVDKLILIVSHSYDSELKDEKIKELEVEDYTIDYEDENYQLNIVEIPKEVKKIPNKIIKKISKRNFKNRMFIYLSFLILIIASNFVVSNIGAAIQEIKSGLKSNMNPKSMEIFAPSFNNLIYTYGNKNFVKKIPFYFTAEDKQKIESIEEIDYIQPIGSDIKWIATQNTPDNCILNLNIQLENLDYNKYDMEKYNLSDNSIVNTATEYMLEPQRVSDNEGKITILFGKSPSDGSNEIMIDPYVAMYYAQKYNFDTLKELIGQKIDIPAIKASNNNEINKEYVISGIYAPDYEMKGTSYIIFPYIQNGEADIESHPWKDKSFMYQRASEEFINDFTSAYKTLGLKSPTPKDIEPLKDNAYPGFYIEVKDPKDVPNVVSKIENYDKYIRIESNYTREHSQNFKFVKSYIIKQILFLIVIYMLLIILLIRLSKIYFDNIYNNRIKLMKFGFAKQNIIKCENYDLKKLIIGMTLINLLIISVLIIFLKQTYSIYEVKILIANGINSVTIMIIFYLLIKFEKKQYKK